MPARKKTRLEKKKRNPNPKERKRKQYNTEWWWSLGQRKVAPVFRFRHAQYRRRHPPARGAALDQRSGECSPFRHSLPYRVAT
jgi:glutathione S-transferase